MGFKIVTLGSSLRRHRFSRIYARDLWNGGSGPGSSPSATVSYRNFLESWLDEHDVETILDIGCGDWQFSRLIDFKDADYLGVDIVPSVIQKNIALYAHDKVKFELRDFTTEDVPTVDLILCKDVLQHLSNRHVQALLQKFENAARHILVTNDRDPRDQRTNCDIRSGGYRPLDLKDPPFNFISERVFEFDAAGFRKEVLYALGKRAR